MINLSFVYFACSLVLLTLILVAVLAERRYIPERWVTSPLSYILSLGIMAGGNFFYGAIAYSHDLEFGYFYFFFGMASMFLGGHVVLRPIHQLIQYFRFESLADLLAFRFRHASVGPLLTLITALAFIPITATQLSSIEMSVALVASNGTQHGLALAQKLMLTLFFALAITTFNFVLSSYRINRRQRNNGLIAMVGLETMIRLFALAAVAVMIIWGIFGGIDTMTDWAETNYVRDGDTSLVNMSGKSILLMSFAASLCLPHVFHMVFGEATPLKTLKVAFWGLPLLLLVLSLPLLPIVWGGAFTNPETAPTSFLMSLPIVLEQPVIQMLVLIARVCTYFSVTVVMCMVATTLLINYVILPVFKPRRAHDLSGWMRHTRRAVGTTLMFLSWLICVLTDDIRILYLLSVLAICIFCQFLPGVIASLFTRRASSEGFLAGLICGIGSYIWLTDIVGLLQCPSCSIVSDQNAFPLSMLINTLIFLAVSWLKPLSEKDQLAAKLFATEKLQPSQARIASRSVDDFATAITPLVGAREAQQQVQRALRELNYDSSEQRPFALLRLRDLLERNLSEKLGLSIAQNAINQLIPYTLSQSSTSQHFAEELIEQINPSLSGIAGELDRLRRFHRQTLARLPVGVCYISNSGEIVLWNNSMEALTQLKTHTVEGGNLDQLAEPWRSLIGNIIESDNDHYNKIMVELNGAPRWLTIHKEKHHLDDRNTAAEDHVIVIEDVSEVKTLEDELVHTERLASVGRLAAGVAHEIGNPVTGIACLAQNLKLDSDDPEVLATAADIIAQTNRISSIMESLISFSHSGKIQVEYHNSVIDPERTLLEAIKLSNLDLNTSSVEIYLSSEAQARVYGDEQRLLQVFLNLIKNAKDACQHNGQIRIQLQQSAAQVSITITDNGSGIPKAIQEQIFEPFFTTKDAGQGTGLGLALVFSIIEDHQGSIKVVSPVADGHGTQFIIRLPAHGS